MITQNLSSKTLNSRSARFFAPSTFSWKPGKDWHLEYQSFKFGCLSRLYPNSCEKNFFLRFINYAKSFLSDLDSGDCAQNRDVSDGDVIPGEPSAGSQKIIQYNKGI